MITPIRAIKLDIKRVFIISVRRFYDSITKEDTIFAPQTAISPARGSPLSVIRVSGRGTEHVLQKFTKNLTISRYNNDELNKQAKIIKPRRATLAKLYNFNDQNDLIDIGLVLWFPKPNSYTGEDCCEFHIHGSQSIQSKMLNLLGTLNNVRPAEPGEFTRRAVMNKKMTLLEAESLNDLISSKTDFQRRLSLKGLSGSTRLKYDNWMNSLVGVLAHLEASLDFGEDELVGEEHLIENCIKKLVDLSNEISTFIKSNTQLRNFSKNGAKLAILGKPNAGKSTLMNILCQREKSIVSDLSGTTRDIIEHSFEVGGYPVTLCDTAGLKELEQYSGIRVDGDILEKHHDVEREGISRAIETAKSADIVIYVIDATKLPNSDNEALVKVISSEFSNLIRIIDNDPKNIHLLINKIDLNQRLKDVINCDSLLDGLRMGCNLAHGYTVGISLVSCTSAENLNQITNHLVESLDRLVFRNTVANEHVDHGAAIDSDYINERHLAFLKSTQRHLKEATELRLTSIDEIAEHVRVGLDYLSRIVGTVSEEQVFDVIFRDFCIGK